MNNYIYPGAQILTPYLNITDCRSAIEFYKKAFNAKEILILDMPDGKIGHAELDIYGGRLMLAEENPSWGTKSPQTLGGTASGIGLYVEDVDTVFAQAIAAGATQTMPIEDQFYGDRTGAIMDPFGHKWTIATHKEDVTHEEMQKRMKELFTK